MYNVSSLRVGTCLGRKKQKDCQFDGWPRPHTVFNASLYHNLSLDSNM